MATTKEVASTSSAAVGVATGKWAAVAAWVVGPKPSIPRCKWEEVNNSGAVTRWASSKAVGAVATKWAEACSKVVGVVATRWAACSSKA